MKWKLILFDHGRRIEKKLEDPRPYIQRVKDLKSQGKKIHLVSCNVIDRFQYPPLDDDLHKLMEGKMWCPYCRDWRYFSVPDYKEGARVDTDAWYMNCFSTQLIRVCQWCRISELDFYVRRANDLGDPETKRRGKRKSRRRRRVA